jgi:hypothetical protein
MLIMFVRYRETLSKSQIPLKKLGLELDKHLVDADFVRV